MLRESTANPGLVYYSAADLAKRYHIHPITVWKWSASGQLPKPVKLAPGTTHGSEVRLTGFAG